MVVRTTTLRKLRKRSCSRSAAELAPRTAVTILPRSSSTSRLLLLEWLVLFGVLYQGVIRILHAKLLGDALERLVVVRSVGIR